MYSGCFEVPLGKKTPMKLSLHKLGSGHIEASVTMNGHTLKVTDDKISSKDAPNAIDVIAIEYPNSRKYTFVELGLPE